MRPIRFCVNCFRWETTSYSVRVHHKVDTQTERALTPETTTWTAYDPQTRHRSLSAPSKFRSVLYSVRRTLNGGGWCSVETHGLPAAYRAGFRTEQKTPEPCVGLCAVKEKPALLTVFRSGSSRSRKKKDIFIIRPRDTQPGFQHPAFCFILSEKTK